MMAVAAVAVRLTTPGAGDRIRADKDSQVP